MVSWGERCSCHAECNGISVPVYNLDPSVLFSRGFSRTFCSHSFETFIMSCSDFPLSWYWRNFSTVLKSSICFSSHGASNEAHFCTLSNGNKCPPFWTTSFSTFPASTPPLPPRPVPVRANFSACDATVLIDLKAPNNHKTFGRTFGRFSKVRTISGRWKRCVAFSTSKSGATNRAWWRSANETKFERRNDHAS